MMDKEESTIIRKWPGVHVRTKLPCTADGIGVVKNYLNAELRRCVDAGLLDPDFFEDIEIECRWSI